MSLRVAPYVTIVDLSAGLDAVTEEGFAELQRSQLPIVREGLVDTARVLVIGSEEQVRGAQEIMELILVAPSVHRTLCVVCSQERRAGAAAGPVELPAALERETVGVIWVGDARGVLWQPGSAKTRALTVSRSDPDGASVLAALTDALRAPKVFDAVFAATGPTKTASSPGLRLLVPDAATGLLGPGEHAAVEEVTGANNSQLAARIEAPFWERESGLSFLLGEAPAPADDDLFATHGEIGIRVTAVKRAVVAAHQAVDAVLAHPLTAQTQEVADSIGAVGQSLGALKLYLKRELLEVIDGSNGLDPREIEVLRRAGLRAAAIRPAQEVNADESENRLRELVSAELLRSRSLLAVAAELRARSATATPRSSAQTVADLELACPDELVEELRGFPPMRIHLGGRRPMIALLVIGLAAMCLPAPWMAIPAAVLPVLLLALLLRAGRPARRLGARLSMGVERWTTALAFLVLGGLVGLLIVIEADSSAVTKTAIAVLPIACPYWVREIWRESIRRWTHGTRLRESSEALDALTEMTATVTMNDWVLANPRVRYARTAARLADSLEEIRAGLLGELAPTGDDAPHAKVPHGADACNPAIRVDLSEATGAALLRYVGAVGEIIAHDYADLIIQAVEDGWVEMVAGPGEHGMEIISRAFAERLGQYRRDLRTHGLFRSSSRRVGSDDADADSPGALRRELLARIWSDTDGLEELLSVPIESELVQLCGPHHLLLLDEDPAGAHMVRFAPDSYRASRRGPAPIQTSSMLLAGVMRLVPLRAGTVRFDD